MEYMHYDYVIVGAGAAGLQLALRFYDDSFFAGKSILILDADDKTRNDRTWSFWEEGTGRWDHLIHLSWNTAAFFSDAYNAEISLGKYHYKSLRSIDFYRFAIEKLKSSGNIRFEKCHVESIENEGRLLKITTGGGQSFSADLVFDSRIDPNFYSFKYGFSRVWQHFLGWEIEADTDVFNPGTFTMMDFRLRFQDTCSFTYILPSGKRKALVEFTFFSPDLVNKEVYEQMLVQYITRFYPGVQYKLLDVEYGVIPMSDYPFDMHSSERVIKIGTAGSWAKPSTGYSFKNCERYLDRLMQNLKESKPPGSNLISKRHRLYDTLFLDILLNKNNSGPGLFANMYSKNPIDRIFRFLDDQSTFGDDLKIMWSFNSLPFIKVIIKKIGIIVRQLLR